MNYNELLKKLWKDLKPKILQLIKEENTPMKRIKEIKENLEGFKDGLGIVKELGDLFSGKKDKGLDAKDMELGRK